MQDSGKFGQTSYVWNQLTQAGDGIDLNPKSTGLFSPGAALGCFPPLSVK